MGQIGEISGLLCNLNFCRCLYDFWCLPRRSTKLLVGRSRGSIPGGVTGDFSLASDNFMCPRSTQSLENKYQDTAVRMADNLSLSSADVTESLLHPRFWDVIGMFYLLRKMNQSRILPLFSIRFNITFSLSLSLPNSLLPLVSISVMIHFCSWSVLHPLRYLLRYCFFVTD
jgi:hypothetical protein